MIDYIRLRCDDIRIIGILKGRIFNHPKINVKSIFDHATGESTGRYIGTFENISIKIYKSHCIIENSLHVLYNVVKYKEKSNYNQFNYSQLLYIISYLENIIGINLNTFYINGLEMGFNLEISTNPTEFLNRNVFLYNFVNFNNYKNYQGKRSYFSHSLTDLNIKFYDKSHQFKIESNILRFEVKFKSKRKLKSIGIKTIDDIKDKSKLKSLFQCTIKYFENILIVDKMESKDFSSLSDHQMYKKGRTENYWRELNKSNAYRKIKFLAVLKKNGLLKLKDSLFNQLKTNFEDLLL